MREPALILAIFKDKVHPKLSMFHGLYWNILMSEIFFFEVCTLGRPFEGLGVLDTGIIYLGMEQQAA